LICQDLLQVFQSDSNPFAALQKPLMTMNWIEAALGRLLGNKITE